MKQRITFPVVFVFIIGIFIGDLFGQQQLTVPFASQKASVMQRVGLTDITIEYHRPSVNGREVWGKLVPYNVVWRAGANDNTTISFTDAVKVNGKEVPAGTYGLHMIPTESEWTIILSKQSTAWGSFFYDQSADQLRFTVKPVAAEHKEYLSYEFETSDAAKTQAALRWEKLKIPFNIDVDVDAVVLNSFRNQLIYIQGFFWQPWNQAALYCAQKKINQQEAMQWAEKSINMNKNFNNLRTKSVLLENKGENKGAQDLMIEAMALANEADLNNYGYQLLGEKKIDKAIEIFKMNVDKYPDSWNVYDSLAEGYQNKGENKLAVEFYKKALDKVKDETQKKRINDTLKGLATN